MLPLIHPTKDEHSMDQKPNECEPSTSKELVGDVYPLEPLVLGESAVNFRHSEVYGEATHDPYKHEIVGMEPSYLADWKGNTWGDVSTPKAYQDTCPAIAGNQFSIETSYGDYIGHMPCNPHDSFTSTGMYARHGHPTSTPSYGATSSSLLDSTLYNVGSYHPMLKDMSSFTTYAPSMTGSYEQQTDNMSGYDPAGNNPFGGRYYIPKMQNVSTDGSMQEMANIDVQKRPPMPHMGEYRMRPESIQSSNSEFFTMLTQQFLGPAKTEAVPKVAKVTIEELTTFTAQYDELCKPLKRKIGATQRADSAAPVAQKHAPSMHPLPFGEASHQMATMLKPKMGHYDTSVHGLSPHHVLNHGHCDPHYMCDKGFAAGHTTATSTPTFRSRMMPSGSRSVGDADTELTTFQHDGYHPGDIETMKTAPVDSNVLYSAHKLMTDCTPRSHFDPNMVAGYPQGMMSSSVDMTTMLSRQGSEVDTSETHGSCDNFVDPSSADTHADDYSGNMIEKPMPAYKGGSVGGATAPDEHHYGSIDGLNNFKGIMDTFRDDDNNPPLDPALMRQAFQENRYIEDLGTQYGLTCTEASIEEAYVYIRSGNSGDFGGVSLKKEKVTTAPIATSSELNEILIECCNDTASFQPVITWNESQQAHIVTWQASNDSGKLEKHVRTCSAAGYGKAAAYEEALRIAMYAETQIRPGALIRWYPGFNIPIGTGGRTNLRKVLHMDRLKNAELCDPVLAANGMKIATKSTFGDMTIVELYKAAYVLGLWDVAAYNCLKTCKRRGYSYRWIHQLQLKNRRVTLDALKYLRDVRETLSAQQHSKRSARGSTRGRAR
ncbi:CCAAT-box DNA binding protein subunit B, putative [Babesia ovis]|uniref:CCAAT-box DNA binding protein subunit B, putative n=1 Tax=Babesia ovis TaxID=5869 RepID=A0A9W5TDM5_BABOV|nr:CCAAT-box DNA binding protein subunit B, putative [Babesia ovis]